MLLQTLGVWAVFAAGCVMPAVAGDVEVIGHRGASYDAPENTLAAVELAWRQGADSVEIDVWLSRDGQIVVIHDERTKRVAGVDRAVVEQTFAELRRLDVGRWKDERFAGERIPSLAEVLATVPEGQRLFIEIKCGPEIVPALQRELAKSGKRPEQTAVIAFSLETVTAVKRTLPDIECFWIVELKPEESDAGTRGRGDAGTRGAGRLKPTAGELVRKATAAGLDGIDIGNSPPIDEAFVATVKDAELELYVWTVNDPDAARRLAELGVDGLTTDRPGWLRERLGMTR